MKRALVTGAGKRLGREFSLRLQGMGYDVALHYNTTPPDFDGPSFQADLSDLGSLGKLIPEVVKKMGRLDLLINSAAVYHKVGFLQTDATIFEEEIAINLRAPFFLTQAFANAANGGAHIVNITTAATTDRKTAYTADVLSKKALEYFTLLSARQLAPKVRVNAIAPGSVLSPDRPTADYEKNLQKLIETIPLKRRGTPSEIVEAMVFLETQTFLTGQILFVDGGLHV
jgi:pteridine reductase